MEKDGKLSRIVRNVDAIICEIPKCEIKGHYYRCYSKEYKRCDIYKSYLLKKFGKDEH